MLFTLKSKKRIDNIVLALRILISYSISSVLLTLSRFLNIRMRALFWAFSFLVSFTLVATVASRILLSTLTLYFITLPHCSGYVATTYTKLNSFFFWTLVIMYLWPLASPSFIVSSKTSNHSLFFKFSLESFEYTRLLSVSES